MAAALAPGVSRKLKKVLETRTDSPDLLASLGALSTFYEHNTPQARRNLKSSVEQRALAINRHFLDASLPAQKALDRVEGEVHALDDSWKKIEEALSSCSASTGDIISTTERLQQELEVITQRQEIVSCFLRDYQLSNEEIHALREEDIDEKFFKALLHVQEIHSNCKVLLRTHHQRAGLELMDMMSVYQEGAYERLCRWVQVECKKLGDTDNPEVSELLKKAVRCLKERPVLFKYCAEEVANMRHHALFRRFISALTRGGPGGLPRPIEVHAHDPLRYVGDMLGWLHQALASERELIAALLDPDAISDSGPANHRHSVREGDSSKGESDFTFVLDRIFEGACRPFKVRVEQVLQSQPSLIVSYKLSNTLEFYGYTISELLGVDTSLCNTIWSLRDATQRTFFNILKSRGEKLLRYPPLVAVDLSPPPAVREGVSLLLELISTYNSMMISASGKGLNFDPVISAILDPIIQSGESSSKVYLINCLSAIEEPLMDQEVATSYVKNLRSMIETHTRALVDKEADSILSKCGLSSKMPYMKNYSSTDGEDDARPLADVVETSPQMLLECLKAFYGIVTGTEGSLPEFEQLQVPRLRSDACYGLARALAEAYELIYKAVMDPKNCYPDPRSLVKHSPEQIRTILEI
ncbi:hypothetical protein CFC21_058360 [Triticum aestivum]|uniref:Conserved oligomeric Golgi complex subunit 6 n=3 Tax=Triticum TaxID=4564 RepID=A0A9R0T6G4_TRITD|nr:hypothetical protein CFC21_058360 [Triticum aestivum]VAI08111.1 unnamed protein product [Triticum turgidum subsp. durum]